MTGWDVVALTIATGLLMQSAVFIALPDDRRVGRDLATGLVLLVLAAAIVVRVFTR